MGHRMTDGGRIDDESEQAPAGLDISVPHSARMYDWWIGGKDNFAADRELGARFAQAIPSIPAMARENRNFMHRVVRYLSAQAGIRQFLDIGTGIPTRPNVHEIAQGTAADSRVVYVDNDPLVLVHARALLTSSPEGATDYLAADVRDPEAILRGAKEILNFAEPVALMMLGILGNVTDYDQARAIVDRLVSALPSGSYLVINDGTNVINPAARDAATRASIEAGTPYIARHPDQIAGFFHGLDLVEPGVVSSSLWRPDSDAGVPAVVDVFCGVAKKP